MKSAAQYHFPQIYVEDGQKWLFNPVLKKRFKNRPEERVRLQWVEFLLRQTDWSKNRIGFETPVQLRREERALRADLLLYSDDVAPHVLIECKSDHVKLSNSAAVQASRYNSLLNAPFIILTNGIDDFVYEVVKGEAKKADYPFNVFQETLDKNLEYWQKRGFCSEVIRPDLKEHMARLQSVFWEKNSSATVNYLSFKESFLPVPMDHYYQIYSEKEHKKLAVTLLGYRSSANYMVAVLNEKGVNLGVCAINLDELTAGKKGSLHLFLQKKSRKRESVELRELIMNRNQPFFHKTLVKILLPFFD